MARPTTIPSWATAITPATPSAGTLQVGAVAGQAASPDDSNWIWKYLAEWSTYTSEISPSDRLLDVDAIRSTASGAGVTPTALTLTGLSLSLQGSDGTTATQWTMAAGSAIFTYNNGTTTTTYGAFVPAYGWAYTIGQIVTAGTADDGFRYGYWSSTFGGTATPVPLDYYLADGNGGWSPNGTASGLGTGYSSTGYVTFIYPAAGSAFTWHRSLSGELSGHNAAAAAGTLGYTARIVGLSGNLDASTGDDILVEVVAQVRATNAETPILQIPSTGTPHSGAATTFTDTGAHSVDLATNRYFVRVTCTGTGSAALVSCRDLKLTIDKYAVE
jgi:hypothetical protein